MKASKPRVTGLCEGNPLMTGGFLSQSASNAEMFPFHGVIMAHTMCIMSSGKSGGSPGGQICVSHFF